VAPAARFAWPAVALAHAAAVLWFFGGALSGGRLLYYRDLSHYYAPDYAFAAASLRGGVWPLWNPLANAGEPCLFAYPVDILLLLIGGPRAPLGPGAALHLLVALLGGSALARRLGLGPAGAWAAGATYGLGGFLLSTVNLPPLFQAAAWAPWVLAALLGLVREPSGRRIAFLAVLAAMQVTTLGAEIVLQTALVGLALAASPRLLRGRRVVALLVAGAVAAALAMPALAGARALVAGSVRERGIPIADALAFSLHPVVLAETVLPKLLGDPQGFSDVTFWGRAYFPAGHPYLLTLYLGVAVLLLAARARGGRTLWGLALAGVLLGLGSHGPLGLLPEGVRLPVRGPQKLFFLTHMSLALLAGLGLERALSDRPRGLLRLVLLAPGAALTTLAIASWLDPVSVRAAAGALAPPLLDPRGLVAARALWPPAWLASGALALGAGLSLARGGRWALAAAVMAAVDLATVNAGVNPLAPASFYELRPDVARVVRSTTEGGRYRFFSYGVAGTPGLLFEPVMSRVSSDVWLFYLDRQALLPRTPALDGLESAFGVDRTGFAAAGSTLLVSEAVPARFARHARRLEAGNVRWVLSFEPLPPELASRRAEVKFPEIVAPLRLYELEGALPRAFWTVDTTVGTRPRPATAEGVVTYEPVDAHTVRLRARTPPGIVVVLDGYHPDWTAEDESGPVRVLVAGPRYRALPTPGGDRHFTLRYRPRWRAPAQVAAAIGALCALALALRR
jgi:hypothetical protein